MPDEPAAEAPRLTPALELLWDLRERPRRGPKPALRLDQIVRAAVQIADTEGLAAVSMSRVADSLGFSTMSLYRYVATKEDLLVLMVDAATDDPPNLAAAGDDWRAGLQLWARANLDQFIRRPWVMQVAITGPPVAPKQVAWMEAALQVLARTPLSPAEQIGVLQFLGVHVLGEARLAVDLLAAQSSGPPRPGTATYGELLGQLVEPQRHPALSAVVAAGVFDQGTAYTDEDYSFGLGRVLDGIGVLIQARGAQSGAVSEQE